MRIFVDFGHGGQSRGNQHGHRDEAEWTLEFGTLLVTFLRAVGHEVRTSRDDDSTVSLAARGQAAAEFEADLVISVHSNAIVYANDHPRAGQPIEDVDGLMTFHLEDDRESGEIGDAICRAAPAGLLRRDPRSTSARSTGWTRRAHNVLRHHRGRRAVLVEYGFTTSPNDLVILEAAESVTALIAATYCGVGRARELSGVEV